MSFADVGDHAHKAEKTCATLPSSSGLAYLSKSESLVNVLQREEMFLQPRNYILNSKANVRIYNAKAFLLCSVDGWPSAQSASLPGTL